MNYELRIRNIGIAQPINDPLTVINGEKHRAVI